MLIGEDFPKIEFSWFGLDLVEPNALIGDTLILFVALFLARKTQKLSNGSSFFKYWMWFYIIFGLGFFAGGLGHAFFNYWGVPGKYASWLIGIVSAFFIELAMISIYPVVGRRHVFNRLAFGKLVLALTVEIIVLATVDLTIEPAKGLIVPTISSVIGLGIILGGLGYYYQKKIHPSFKYLWISTLVLIPNTAIQGMKINIHPWFDRNDFSHVLLITGCFLYMITIQRYAKFLAKEKINGRS
jgi:hypothetical protein